LENEIELSDIVDKVLEDVESTLGKLEKNFKLNQKEEITPQQEIQEEKEKVPFPSVRYPTEYQDYEDKQYTSIKKEEKPAPAATVEEIEESKEVVVENTQEISVENNLDIPITQSIPSIPAKQAKTIEKSIIQFTETLVTEEDVSNAAEITLDEETHFIDINRNIRLIHIFGPPGSSKTTLGIQAAIEIVPRKTYYFITSHGTSVLKRAKQMISDVRWSDFSDIKQCFFPIEITNLDDLEIQLEKIANLHPDELGLVVIDHVTDYLRGQIHKEEKRTQLRNLLEKLYLLADEKKCKVLVINGFSYKDSAPAEDIIESFCDMTIKTKVEDFKSKITLNGDEIIMFLNNSGIANLHLNIYY
jgi:hypothetical protein